MIRVQGLGFKILKSLGFPSTPIIGTLGLTLNKGS